MPKLTLVPPEIEEYAHAHTTAPAPLFEELREITYAQMASPQMQVGRVEGTFLRFLVALSGARRVLEIGTFTGYSALMMAEGLPDDGELVTCDINPKAAEVARSFFARSPHGRKIQLRLGPALETLKTLEGPFDLAFIDADKGSYGAYWDAVLPLLRPGGLVVADNVLWSGRVLQPEATDDHAIVTFNAKVAADPRVEQVLLTVRDGMMLARKR
ncbi:O-methyltransferase [Myxococcus sp. RHSTA-1-4]|uniref:O-methyltransferase n=1 Tax=Myxococcus sp. RHSTA-1-4 TaxID=2874601 RepID=UPI001CBF93E6|nr:class I SAM-dependent methyltransferase [Myxococcus sp. RHSTA-1-4]MBZ4421035.1 class I SAM-dependent methyltransferase [Myxococcus sp. RHSTA-1-4]